MSSFELPPLIGIGGGNGSGKTTVGSERFERTGLPFMDSGDPLRVQAEIEGKDPEERSNLRDIARRWGEQYKDPAILVKKALELFGQEAGSVVSVRRVAEAEYIKKLGGAIIWVEAPIDLRHQRVISRARGSSDIKTLEAFIADENKEMYSTDPSDPFNVHMSGVRDMADFTFNNIAPSEEKSSEEIARTFNLPSKQ